MPTFVFSKPLRWTLWGLTVLSLSAALFLQPALNAAVSRGAISKSWLSVPALVYCFFFLVFTFDRYILVKNYHYPTGRAFFQIVFGLAFVFLLLPFHVGQLQEKREQSYARLLSQPDPFLRKVAVEALAYRGPDVATVHLLLPRLEDRDADVRHVTKDVLSKWSCVPTGDPASIQAWASALSATSTSTMKKGASECVGQ